MSAVEHKIPGWYVNDEKKLRARLKQPGDGEGDGFGYDVFPFEDHEFSYALGAQVRFLFSFLGFVFVRSFWREVRESNTRYKRTANTQKKRAHFHVDPPSSSMLGVRSTEELIVSADGVAGLRMCSGSRARPRRARKSPRLSAHSSSFVSSFVLEPRYNNNGPTHPRLTLTSANRHLQKSRQGSTRKKLAAASGALLEYVGRAAGDGRDARRARRCWDYLTWLLKQRRAARFTVLISRSGMTARSCASARRGGRVQGSGAARCAR